MDTSVYIDSSALEEWSTELTSVNNELMNNLNAFLETAKSLENSWAGIAASSFLEQNASFIKKAEDCHEKMSDVNSFLLAVIETMEKE